MGNQVQRRQRMKQEYLAAIRYAKIYGADHYNLGLAESAGEDPLSLQRNLVERLIDRTPIDKRSALVDVGSGIGGAVYQIAREREARLAVGLELRWPNLCYAVEQGRDLNGRRRPVFVQGDAQSLPLATGSFDVIFSLESAFHYPDKGTFLRECHRVLRPGGHLLIGDLVAERKLPRLVSRSQGAFFWSGRDYSQALDRCGLLLESTEDVSVLVVNSIRLALRWTRQKGIRSWWPCRKCLLGVWGAGRLLRQGRLRYILLRARA